MVLDGHVLTLDVAGFVQPFAKRRRKGRRGIGRTVADKPDYREHWLLRTRYDRACGRNSYDFNEIAPSHCLPQGSGITPAMTDYSRDLRLAKWGSGASLHGSNPEPLMSALGQKQTSKHAQSMSALPPKADIG
jgi:hypothetical protein